MKTRICFGSVAKYLLRTFFIFTTVLFPSLIARADEPGITVTFIPPVGSSAELAGRATNIVYSNYKVALVIRVFGGYWSKPTFASPSTTIANDGTWHMFYNTGGSDGCADEFRCYLVPSDFVIPLVGGAAQPPPELENGATAKAVVKRNLNSRELIFSNYRWICKSSCGGITGPGNNSFSDSTENIFVDEQGRLHLRITYRNGRWQCAEIISQQSFGYGTYVFQIDSVVDAWHRSIVAGFFTWSDVPDFVHREIDIEISPWQGSSNTLQFVRQPFDSGTNLLRVPYPIGVSAATHSFKWKPSKIYFQSFVGNALPSSAPTNLIREWTYADTNQIPVAGGENARINLWLNGTRPTDTNDIELIVSKFTFIPAVRVDSIVRTPSGVTHIGVLGESNLSYTLLGSTNTITFDPLTNVIATNQLFYVDDHTPSPVKIYRVRLNE